MTESRRSNSIQAKQSVPGTLAIDPSTAGILWNRTKPTQMLLSVRMDELKDPHWGSKSASPSSLLLAIDPWQRHCSPYIPRLGFGAAPATALTRGRAGQTILEIAGRLPLRCSQITILWPVSKPWYWTCFTDLATPEICNTKASTLKLSMMVIGVSCLSTVPTSKDITSMFSTIRMPEVRKAQMHPNAYISKFVCLLHPFGCLLGWRLAGEVEWGGGKNANVTCVQDGCYIGATLGGVRWGGVG